MVSVNIIQSKHSYVNKYFCEKTYLFIQNFKLQFIGGGCEGMRKDSALDPQKNFLKKVLLNLKNFQKRDKFHQFSL